MMRGFLSYSREDHEFATWFRGLMSRADPALDLWMDESLEGGAAYAAEIFAEVDRAEVFYAVLSQASLSSTWCRNEWSRAATRSPPPGIVPLLLEDVDVTGTPLVSYQVVDLRRWRIDGDRVVRERIRAAAVGSAPPPTAMEALRRVLLWAARSDVTDEVARDLAHLACALTAGPGEAMARARLSDALAGLHLTRRRWREMDEATEAALSLVVEAGWQVETPGDRRTDAELGFLGELHNRRALAARQRGERAGRTHAERALRWFDAIRQPLERDERAAQAHRELGTHAQLDGDLESARVHFRESGRRLEGVPSQTAHLAQAAIKEAQVDLVAGDLGAARALLDLAARRLENSDALLVAQVRPHLLITDAVGLALEGRDGEARAALGRYRDATTEQGRNEVRWAAVRGLLVLPLVMRPFVVRAVLWGRRRI